MTEHFRLEEFRCTCGECNFTNIDYLLVIVLELVREHFKQPVIVTSANRCYTFNRKVGGHIMSKHQPSVDMNGQTYATAVDFVVKDVEVQIVYDYLNKMFPSFLGIGLYLDKGFVHIDSRLDKKYRWSK